MVAAWMSADTGVGPSIASPSQDCSGTCADLPHAASNSSSPIAVSVPSQLRCGRENTGERDRADVGEHHHQRDGQAEVADAVDHERLLGRGGRRGLVRQNPISRYDARPTPSHPTYRPR